jgi:ATP-binding cassette subfamily A (ABC1) protein 3
LLNFLFNLIKLLNFKDNSILRIETGNPLALIVPATASIKIEGHNTDKLYDFLVGNFATYTVLPFILIFLRMTYGLLLE